MLKKIGLVLLAVLVLIQFIPVNRSAEPIRAEEDFITAAGVPGDIAVLLKQACYDCHSYETVYPWYDRIAPVSWMLRNHIKEGREELNFSVWSTFSEKKKQHKLDECYELVGEGEMPLKGYSLMHSEARLSDVQRKTLTDWFLVLSQSKPNPAREESE